MRVLVLHSDVGPNPLPEDQDTLIAAQAISSELQARGHEVRTGPFFLDFEFNWARIQSFQPDIVFNMVEAVFGKGELAPIAASMFEALGVPYTGARAGSMALTNDKPLTKNMLVAANLPTPDWSLPPRWEELEAGKLYIVKSATEDASLGLDDTAVVPGDAAPERAELCRAKFGGQWFAEEYVEGREFNVSLLETPEGPSVLPVPEMRFENWEAGRPRIVGYTAKWDDTSEDSVRTVRAFGLEQSEPELHMALVRLSLVVWTLFNLRGYARVDFRVDAAGQPTIMEINANPCLHPEAGFASAGYAAGLSYGDLLERILHTALTN
jgi:D-alanine-D-alanine ligase